MINLRHRSRLYAAALASVCAPYAHADDLAHWLRQHILDRIQISGYRQLGFHSHVVEGDKDTFNSLTYFGQGARRFTDTGNVGLVGQDVLGILNFQMVIPDSRFQDPENQHISLNYHRNGLKVDLGDLTDMAAIAPTAILPGTLGVKRPTASAVQSPLRTNPYAQVGRQLNGISVEYANSKFSVAGVRSFSKAQVKTISFTGNNSPGPYYIQNGRLVSGSEGIELDGVRQNLNTDYVIDYEVGAVTFTHPIAPTQTVVVTYEAYDFNSGSGEVQGVGAAYDFGKAGRVGVNWLTQKSPSSGALSSRVEQFEGFGAPSTPYFLQFVPVSTAQYPTFIRIDGLLQTEGTDYSFDTSNPAVFFIHRFVPSTSIVEVTYFPKPSATLDGDREVIGLEYRLPLGQKGSVGYSEGRGKLKNAITPLQGVARSINASYDLNGLKLRGSIRDTPDGFVTVDSTGFNRNERAYTLGASFDKGSTRWSFDHRGGKIGTRRAADDGTISFTSANQGGTGFQYEIRPGHGLTWSAQAKRDTVSRLNYDSRIDTVSAGLSRTTGRLDTTLGLDRQTGNVSDASGSRDLSLNTLRLGARYRPDARLSLDMQSSLSSTKYGADSGAGRDISVNASYRANKALTLDAGWIDSKAGALSTLAGFQGGYGLGFDGNGFSGGLGAAYGSGGSDLQSWRLHAGYRPSSVLSLDAKLERTSTQGDFSTNTKSTIASLVGTLTLGREHYGSFAISQSDTSFRDSSVTSKSTFLQGAFRGNPRGPWSYSLSGNMLLTGGGDFSQNSLFGDASLTYRLNRNANAGFRASLGRSHGYLGQNDDQLNLFYEHRLYGNVSLITSYKIRSLTNTDPLASSTGYRSRGFDIELSFNFGG